MAPFRNISVCFILFAIISCTSKKPEYISSNKAILLDSEKVNAPFIGQWESPYIFMYSSKLTVDKNKTFSFHDKGCTGGSISNGNWTLKDGNLILESYASYNTENSHIPKYVFLKKEKPSKNNNYTEVSLMYDTAATVVRQYHMDSIPIYFASLHYKLENDTLYQLDKTGQKTEVKFIKSKNIR